MLLRLENSFIQLSNKLGKSFSEEGKGKLAKFIEEKYDEIRKVISELEKYTRQSEPTKIELGNTGGRFFALNIYYSKDDMGDDIPISVKQLLPSQSPVHMDIMASISDSPGNLQENYLKAGEVYDDGDIHSHYIKEIRQEDLGISPMDYK
ncbi:MAG: hypothetical protein WAM88_13585 [Nitrososphaeraceae archaeon]